MRTRVQTKKQRQLMDVNSHKKHEVALAELAKRRAQQAERMKQKRRQVTEGKGASGTRKYKHKHVEDFQQMKKDHRVRKDTRRQMAADRTKPSRGGGGGGGGSTLGSNTMPDIRRNRQPASRQPATRTAGTVTRRRPVGKSQPAPSRRGRSTSRSRQDDHVMPPIVGSGVGGARKLKQQKRGNSMGMR